MRRRSEYEYIAGMSDDVVATATLGSDQKATLFVKITEDLDGEINEAARKAGVSKSGLVRMALPLGIARLLEQIQVPADS